MGQFAFFAALLGLLAIGFAVSALWRSSRRLAVVLALGLPLAAVGVYALRGAPAALDPQPAVAPTSTIEEAVARLQQRIDARPDNFDDMVLLARSYMVLQDFGLARDTYARAVALRPDDSGLAVEHAESLLHASADGRLPAAAVGPLEKALERNPVDQRALFLLGQYRMQEGRPAEAVATWQTLLPLLTADAADVLRQQIDAARVAAALPPLAEGAAAASTAVAASAAGLAIEIRIDPALADLARPGDALYVFARGPEGTGPPFAAKRVVLGQLPLQLQLTDDDSPMPAARLSSQKQVVVVARLSRSGDVKASRGDIEAEPLAVDTDDGRPIRLVLTRVVP